MLNDDVVIIIGHELARSEREDTIHGIARAEGIRFAVQYACGNRELARVDKAAVDYHNMVETIARKRREEQ
jgi:hypothetical protein